MKRLILILALLALFVGVADAAVLVDCGRLTPNTVPETDGRVYNENMRWLWAKYIAPGWGPGVYWASGAWNVEGHCVDEFGVQTQIGIESNLVSTSASPVTAPYPTNVTEPITLNDAGEGGVGGMKFTNVSPGTYSVKILVGGPVDNTWEAHGGSYTIQGQTFNWSNVVDGVGAVTHTFTNLQPIGGEIQMDMVVRGDQVGTATGYMDIRVMELIPEPATMSLLALGGLIAIRRRR